MNEIFYSGVWRMDWGLGNPNKTAALIAILMLGIWILPYLLRRSGFWIALVVSTGLGIALVHTISRGGIVAFAVGLVPLIAFARRPWPRARLFAAVAAFWILVGASVYLKASQRYTQGIITADRSITNRLLIWKSTPEMMVDAPGGWGFGNAANAFMQWYQPLDWHENILTLVNSHLTWMVEMGWGGRFAYVCGWFLVFWICWPTRANRWLSVPLAVWVCFFTASIFSSSADRFIVWIVPLGMLLAALIYRIFSRKWLPLPTVLLPPAAAACVLCAFLIMGSGNRNLSGSSSLVTLGSQDPPLWVVYDELTMGSKYGKNIRAHLSSGTEIAVGLALAPSSDLPGETVVLGGAIPENQTETFRTLVEKAQRVILLSPRFFPQEIGIDESNGNKVTVIFGDFTQSPSANSWRSIANVQQLAGVGDFISNWPEIVLSEISSKKYGSNQ